MRTKAMIVTGVAALSFADPVGGQQRFVSSFFDEPPPVQVWMGFPEYRPFDKAEVAVRGQPGSYLLVIRIADDGYYVRGMNTVEILYPRANSSQQPLTAAQSDELTARFKVRGGPGTSGAVYAIASSRPFGLTKFPQRFVWDKAKAPPGYFDHRRARVEIASRLLERLGIAPSDIQYVAGAAYDVVDTRGALGLRRSQTYLSTDIFNRCRAGSSDAWCEAWTKR